MSENSHLGFGYVPTSATIDRYDAEETSTNIGLPLVNNDTPIANDKGQNPYIPIEGLISGTQGASQLPYFIQTQFGYDSPDSEINDFASPYTYFEFEGILASIDFQGIPIHDFFKLSYTIEIPDPSTSFTSSPNYAELLITSNNSSEESFSLLTPSSTTSMSYVGSGNNKAYNFRFGIVGGTQGLSYNIRYTFL